MLKSNVFSRLGVHLYEPVLGFLLRGMRQEVLKISLELGRLDTVLDCCCGAGGLLRMYTQNLPSRCLGLDLSPRMLSITRKNAPKAEIMLADATALPFDSQIVDMASICMALHSMPYDSAKQTVQELLRVAKYVIIADYCLAERNIMLPAAIIGHAIEALVGGEHYANYKIFQSRGGLEGFLHMMGISPHKRHTALGGAGKIIVLKH